MPQFLVNPPLRVALLTTNRAPGIESLLDDPARGTSYELVVGIATEPLAETAGHLAAADIPCAIHDLRQFCREQESRVSDLNCRQRFDARTVRFLEAYRPDLVLFDAYLHILTAPMLDAYPGRILNIHDADLTILGPDGLPKYRGLHATYDALAAGEPATRTCVHLVTPELDAGRVLLRSRPFPASPMVAEARRLGATKMLKAYAFAHREWMMRSVWGSLLREAVHLAAPVPKELAYA